MSACVACRGRKSEFAQAGLRRRAPRCGPQISLELGMDWPITASLPSAGVEKERHAFPRISLDLTVGAAESTMSVGLIALHYPKPEFRDQTVQRIRRVTEVMATVPGCLYVDCWEEDNTGTIVTTG